MQLLNAVKPAAQHCAAFHTENCGALPLPLRTGQLVRGAAKRNRVFMRFKLVQKIIVNALKIIPSGLPAAGIRDKNGKNLPPWRISAAPLQGKMQVVFKEILFLFPAFSDRITVQVKQPHVYGHPFSTRRDVLSGLTKSNSRSLNEKGQNSLVKKFIF